MNQVGLYSVPICYCYGEHVLNMCDVNVDGNLRLFGQLIDVFLIICICISFFRRFMLRHHAHPASFYYISEPWLRIYIYTELTTYLLADGRLLVPPTCSTSLYSHSQRAEEEVKVHAMNFGNLE